ncbi:MAG: pentapeptide repeat-containing protein [Gammaproteobacteria bacterium]|nr:pentapeptide repeat-containing protein [Gammaproteobacteria bacterium]NBT45394.1 pentapeptide repeat-containing protein [Gammaproteobacteria bacterium]NDE33853.1 pentapeptide repeat-containing protein [Gammaproteobacteria bacterium]NDE55809.1 pentapeptide repeat-containing protein [Gammaproteobacteria bacterium]NDG86393.1 pentapeptide repeat-containing protein [Gammaproteobacteria bacterium]
MDPGSAGHTPFVTLDPGGGDVDHFLCLLRLLSSNDRAGRHSDRPANQRLLEKRGLTLHNKSLSLIFWGLRLNDEQQEQSMMKNKRSILCPPLISLLWLMTLPVIADPRVVDGCTIKPKTTCYKANLSGVDLSGEDLTSAILIKVNLTGATLKGTKFVNAKMWNSVLDSADLTAADVKGAVLANASLKKATLKQTEMSGAVLVHRDLTGANLDGAKLLKAKGQHANFTEVSMVATDLERANLAYATFTGATLTNIRVKNTLFYGAKLNTKVPITIQ